MKYIFLIFGILYLVFIGVTYYAIGVILGGGDHFTVYLNTYGEKWFDFGLFVGLYIAGAVALVMLFIKGRKL